MIVLDTNVISALLRLPVDTGVAAWLSAQSGRALHTTSITVAELYFGVGIMPTGARRQRLLSGISGYFDEFEGRILSFDHGAALEYAALAAQRRRDGRPISVQDAQIAAIARAHRATLATRNTRDFAGCGIELVDPWQYR